MNTKCLILKKGFAIPLHLILPFYKLHQKTGKDTN